MQEKLISIHGFTPSAAVRVTGEDACEFLQGQFTNDLRQPVGSATYGLWLNQKGKVLADSTVLRIADREFLLISATSRASEIIERLEQYIIADDVILGNETANFRALSFFGEEAVELLQREIGRVPATGGFLEHQGVLVLAEDRGSISQFQAWGVHESIDRLRDEGVKKGGRELTGSEAEFARITAGVPSVPQDLGPSDLPQEAGLEATAISFTKGCYLGQEVMARLKSMGQVRRRLQRVRGTGTAPVHGMPLFQNSKKVGEIRSVATALDGFVAFAMLTRLGLDENAGFALDPAGDPVSTITLWTK